MDIITDILSHLSADVVSMKEEVKHYLAEGVLSSLIEGAGVRGLQAMHGQGQRIEAMAKTAVIAEMIKGLMQKIISGMKLSLEYLIEESADSTEKSYHLKIYILVLGCLFCNVI